MVCDCDLSSMKFCAIHPKAILPQILTISITKMCFLNHIHKVTSSTKLTWTNIEKPNVVMMPTLPSLLALQVDRRCSKTRQSWHFCSSRFSAHYSDVIMGTMSFQITSLTIVYSNVYSGADQRKHQSSASLAFVRRIHRWPVNSPHKWPVMRKIFPFDNVIMEWVNRFRSRQSI